MKWLKRGGAGLGALVLLLLVVGGGYVGCKARAFDQSMARVYDVPVPDVTASKDPELLGRGAHLVESVGACSANECHGADLAGGPPLEMGPLGTMIGPNITPGGKTGEYSDGELFRLLRHAIKNDGRSIQFMPVHESNWLPDDDLLAIISFLRTVPASDKVTSPTEFGLLGKVLDRRDELHIDIARRIDHDAPPPAVPTPAPTKAYGFFLARGCTGCHGATFSGGRIPGTPSSIPVPTNLTPHETGIEHYTYEKFVTLLDTGKKPDGSQLDPFMPYQALAKMNDVEKRALWEYLVSLPAKPFGGR